MILPNSIFYLFIFFIISCGLSYLLYRKHTGLLDVPRFLLLFLSFLRFLSFFILFYLLLNPELIKKEKILEHPLIVFLQDNSASILLGSDSIYYQTKYLQYIDSICNVNNLDIDIIPFDETIKKEVRFDGNMTNFYSVLEQVSNNYANLNVGAYILASDGIYNKGLNPLYEDIRLNAPLYTVLLGDTTQRRDAFISLIRNNSISYLDNQSPVEVAVQTEHMKGSSLIFEVFNHTQDPTHSRPIYSQKININNINDAHKFQFFISSDKPGLTSYYARVKSSFSEHNLTNNSSFFFMDVIDNRQKILLLFSTPHPDVEAIKESLSSYDQYEVHAYWLSSLNNKNLDYIKKDQYDLMITHQLSDSRYFNKIQYNNDVPTWHILGSNTDLAMFNKMHNSLQFNYDDNSFEFANVTLNKNFSSFVISDSLSEFLSFSTPFLTPFSEFKINKLSDVLLYKKIGSLNTDQPIMFFVNDNKKMAFLIGEGLWRWRLNDTYLNGNTNLFNTLMNKVVQNLFSDQDKNKFHINYDPIQYAGTQIIFEAELYNQNFELVNSHDVNIEFTDSLGQTYYYQFNPINDRYYLTLTLEKGKYSFVASTQIGDDSFIKKGDLIVTDFDIEARDLVADDSFLSNLAQSHNGYMVQKDSLLDLINSIQKKPDFKIKTDLKYSYKSLINFEVVLLIILATLCLEWLIRRRYINY